MAEKTIKIGNLVCRNDSSINWYVKNPTLKSGEWGLETDTMLMKFGDGKTEWNLLGYAGVTALTNSEIDDLYANA